MTLRTSVLFLLAMSLPAQSGPYVRTFTAGASLGYNLFAALKGEDYSAYDSTNIISTSSTTTPRKNPLMGGVTVQYAFLENFAISASALYREAGYQSSTTYYAGTDNSNTAIDERKRTLIEETTHAAFFDFPVLVRYYSRDHYTPGLRWFGEAGPALRLTGRVSSEHRNENAVNIVTHNAAPTRPAHSAVPGFAAGLGMQLIDPFGIRYVPQVRYTRWLGQPFDSLSTHTGRQQVEVILSVTF